MPLFKFNPLDSFMTGFSSSISVREDRSVADPEPIVKNPSTPLEGATVKQIHNEFDTAPERLLREAKRIIDKSRSKKREIPEEKVNTLKKLGFTNVPTIKSLQKDIDRNIDMDREININKELGKLIVHYNKEYPFLKFLTEKELDRICDKYGLVYAPVSHYIKEVPDKNLREIADAQKIKDGDIEHGKVFIENITFRREWGHTEHYQNYVHESLESIDYTVPMTGKHKTIESVATTVINGIFESYPEIKPDFDFDEIRVSKINRKGLFIAAPFDHFNMEGLSAKGKGFFEKTTVVVNDPIVFRYVRGGVQVVSKWGEEANDPALQVGINN